MTTPVRPTTHAERRLDAPEMKFNLVDAVTRLKEEETWRKKGRNSITLIKTPGLRVVLIAARQGKEIPSHRAETPITVQILEGRVRFVSTLETVTLAKDELLVLDRNISHELLALEDCVFLLTLAGNPKPSDESVTDEE